ncbi:Os03g0432666, partial [Oryza sativa Japonica Group]
SPHSSIVPLSLSSLARRPPPSLPPSLPPIPSDSAPAAGRRRRRRVAAEIPGRRGLPSERDSAQVRAPAAAPGYWWAARLGAVSRTQLLV